MTDELKITVNDVLVEPEISHFYKFSELFLRVNFDGTILDMAADSSNELYVPASYFIGRKVSELLPERIRSKVDNALFEAQDKNLVKIFDYSVKVNDLTKYFRAKFFPSVNKQVVLIIYEVTRGKRTVKALKQSENKLKIIWENSKEGMRLINSKGIVISVNNAFCKMFETEEQEVVGKPFNIIFKKRKSGSFSESSKLFQERFVSRSIENFQEEEVVLNSGKTIFVEIVNTFIEGIEEGQGELLLSIIRDITGKKKSEETRASLAAIVDNSNDAIIGCNLNGIIQSWNQAAENLFGFKREEITGNSFLRIFPGIEPREFRNVLENIRNSKMLEHNETLGLKQDGTKFYTSVTLSPIKNYQDAVSGFSAIVRDVTERKKAEEILRESEEKYRTLIETSPDAIAMFDPEGNFVMGNIQVARTFGYRNTLEFARVNIFNMVSDEQRKKVPQHLKQLENIGTLKNVHYNLIKKNGETFAAEISASLIKNSAGVVQGVICVFRDITDRIKYELALKRSEEQFRSIWENSGEGMRLSDPEGKILKVNKAFCKLSGLEEDQILGKYFYELYHDNTEAEKERYSRIFGQSEADLTYQAEFNFISGKSHDLHITYSVIDQNENPLVLSIFHDMTEIRKSEREMRKSEKLAAIGKMAAYLAHEIKTPLASIKLNIDMMSATLSLPKDKQRSFSIIQKEVKRLHNLLKNVLQFSRQVDLIFMEINLRTLLESINLLFDTVLQQKQITFINLIPENLWIIGDRQKLQTVFSHLIENAVEAINKKGKIEIASSSDTSRHTVDIFVKDSGTGIQNNGQIFDPFFTTKSSGTGLGLSIAQKIIEQHNGSIEIFSSVPGETIFKIELKTSRKKDGNYSHY